MKLRRLTNALIILATWLAVAPQIAAEPVTFENTPGILSAQDPLGGGASAQGPGSPRIEIIDDGDVTGTIRDCGVIDESPQVFTTKYPKTLAYVAFGIAPDICCLLEICCPGRSLPGCANPPCQITDTRTIPEPITVTTFALGLSALQILMLRRRRRKRLTNLP